MIHLDNRQAGELLALLVWWQENQPEVNPQLVWNQVLSPREEEFGRARDEGLVASPLTEALFDAVGNNGSRLNIAKLIHTIADQYFNTGQTESTLMDKLIGVLNGPYAAQRLTASTIEQLRGALLSQEEQTKVVPLLETQDLKCAGCGQEFHSGEVASLYQEGGGYGAFRCGRCARPRMIKCSHKGCEHHIGVDIVRAKCEQHQGEEDETDSMKKRLDSWVLQGEMLRGAEVALPATANSATARRQPRFTPPPPARRNPR